MKDIIRMPACRCRTLLCLLGWFRSASAGDRRPAHARTQTAAVEQTRSNRSLGWGKALLIQAMFGGRNLRIRCRSRRHRRLAERSAGCSRTETTPSRRRPSIRLRAGSSRWLNSGPTRTTISSRSDVLGVTAGAGGVRGGEAPTSDHIGCVNRSTCRGYYVTSRTYNRHEPALGQQVYRRVDTSDRRPRHSFSRMWKATRGRPASRSWRPLDDVLWPVCVRFQC